ncbi:ParB/Srx family N-terminal domain-containing protein [Sphingopyxis sp.]|uniref:ParB/Srx family N-terminal domain-containing protein n=1 Tax=Sphingopyxis sp. TaxID=1908224 RepID=UPI00258C3337|nr:ParB/Srx family N-terminal domain-containing protein [Sphingopyxis sp.]
MTYIATLPQAQTPSLINFDQRLGPIEYRRPGLLKPYANNPRKHPEKQIVKLVASIRQFGFVLPVLVDGQGTIIAGQARVEAASRLGLAEIPVLVADKWTKSEVRAYRLADNRLAELSSWDGAALAIELAEIIEIGDVNFEVLGWETAEIDVIMNHCDESTSESNPVDVIPGLPKQPVSRIGDLWSLSAHRLLCGSSLDVANWDRLMAGETAQMLFTDAPYNVRIQGHVSGLGKHQHAEFAQASGEMSSEEFSAFLTTAIECAANSALLGSFSRFLTEICAAAIQACCFPGSAKGCAASVTEELFAVRLSPEVK